MATDKSYFANRLLYQGTIVVIFYFTLHHFTLVLHAFKNEKKSKMTILGRLWAAVAPNLKAGPG